MKRRSFLKSAGALAAPSIIPAAVLGREGRTAPSERVTVGLVGAGGKGYDLMRDFYSQCKDEVQFVAIADPDARHAERGKRLAEKNWGEGCRTTRTSGTYALVTISMRWWWPPLTTGMP